jgi:hemoglobin-like flavoprotein
LFPFHRFFTACPAAKVVFGFPIDESPKDLLRDQGKRFAAHASILIQMIETSLNMLGPDIDMVTDIMTGLGPKHVKYGVKLEMFPILGQCLIDTVAECLNELTPSSFTEEAREAWEEVFANLSGDIMKAYATLEPRRRSAI